MSAGVSTDQSESAELTSPVGVGEFMFPQQPYKAIAFTGALGEPNCDSAQLSLTGSHRDDMFFW
jgi:hypothetical protein